MAGNGVPIASTIPIVSPPSTATTSDCTRPAIAAAMAGITTKVRNSGCMRARFASRMPLTPAMTPDIAHAQESTLRIGTPSSALISRRLARARMASPMRVRARNPIVAPVRRSESPSAMRRV